MNNPLAARNAQPQVDPALLQHAQMWQHAHSQDHDQLQSMIKTLDYGLPIIGALAGNPKVTAKDVIKATSAAVADQKLTPSAGVAFITQMPADPDKLRPWLRDKYAMNLSAAVHAKAALMARQTMPHIAPMGAPDGAGAPMPSAGPATPLTSAPPPPGAPQ